MVVSKTISETIKIDFVLRKVLLRKVSRKCRSVGYRDVQTNRFSTYQNINLLTDNDGL